MVSKKGNLNRSRRDSLRRRVLAEEDYCSLCGQMVDKTLTYPDAGSPVVDEDVPRVRGGSPYDRANCNLMHQKCNRWKWKMTLQEARDKIDGNVTSDIPIQSSDIW